MFKVRLTGVLSALFGSALGVCGGVGGLLLGGYIGLQFAHNPLALNGNAAGFEFLIALLSVAIVLVVEIGTPAFIGAIAGAVGGTLLGSSLGRGLGSWLSSRKSA